MFENLIVKQGQGAPISNLATTQQAPAYNTGAQPQYYYGIPQGVMGMMHNIASSYNQTKLGDIIDVVSKDSQPSTQMDLSRSVEARDPELQKSVDMTFTNLVTRSEPKPKDEDIPQYNPQFTNLMDAGVPFQVQKRFALQPLPEDVDVSMLPKPDLVSRAIDDANAHLIKNDSKSYSNSRKLNNWFTRMMDQKGEDYFTSAKISIDDVSRNAEKIIDDMISGRIDYNKTGQIIILPVIIETLINYCSNKLAINKAIQFSLGYVYNDYTNRMMLSNDPNRYATLCTIDDSLSRNIAQSIAIVNQDIGIYETLYNKLMFVNATKNASSLVSLTNELKGYNRQAKKRY